VYRYIIAPGAPGWVSAYKVLRPVESCHSIGIKKLPMINRLPNTNVIINTFHLTNLELPANHPRLKNIG